MSCSVAAHIGLCSVWPGVVVVVAGVNSNIEALNLNPFRDTDVSEKKFNFTFDDVLFTEFGILSPHVLSRRMLVPVAVSSVMFT